MAIYPFWLTQVPLDSLLAALQWDKAPTKIPAKYHDYANVFYPDLAMELPKNIRSNEYTIELIEDRKPLYRPIYALSPIELEKLKTYIKTHLKPRFIQPSKSPANTPILFSKKPNDKLYLCIDY